jgi:hypothetical protein
MTINSESHFDFDAIRQRIEQVRQKDLFFIGGTMKAGTTWLQLMLNGHPEIACRGEGHFTNVLLPSMAELYSRYARYIENKNNTIFNEIDGFPLPSQDHLHYVGAVAMLLILSEYGNDKAIKSIGEKTPNNIRAFPMLQQVFPEAKFITLVRDGRDVAVSAWFHNLRVSPNWATKKYGSFEKFCDHYAVEWQREVEYARSFANANPERVMEMRYEGLHEDTRNEIVKLLGFLGRETSASSMESCLDAGHFQKLAKGRNKGEEDPNSFFRKGVVGDWRNHMDKKTAESFAEKAKGWLAAMGYE